MDHGTRFEIAARSLIIGAEWGGGIRNVINSMTLLRDLSRTGTGFVLALLSCISVNLDGSLSLWA